MTAADALAHAVLECVGRRHVSSCSSIWASLQGRNLRLDAGVRKFDVATGENWSVYFRVVNPKAHKASAYYIVDLSARSPLILTVDSLDIGSGVRRREVWDEAVASHDDVTDQVLSKLLDRAVQEAGQP